MLWILACVAIALLCYEIQTLVAAVLVPLWANRDALQTDFHYYYDAARRFTADRNLLYLLSDDVIAGFAYPPPAIVPFMWLARLPLGAALMWMTIGSYLAVVSSIALWIRYLNRREVPVDARTAVAAGLIAVALGPTYSNAVFGQVNAFVLLCGVGFVTIGSRLPPVGGALLAIGAWLKIYPVLLVVIGLWNRNAWRRIAYAAGAAVLIALIVLPIVPLGAYETFWTRVLPARFDKTAVHISNQSLIAFLERFAMPSERFLNWTGEQAITVDVAIRAFNWAFGVAVLALLWRRAGRGPRVEAVDSAAGVMALAAVIAPLGWGHTYMLVLPLLILHLVTIPNASRARALVISACVVALMVPAGRRFAFIETGPGWFQNVIYSRYLLATLVLILISAWPAARRVEPPPIAPA